MWRKSENSNSVKPLDFETGLSTIYVRKNFVLVEATEDREEHWSYDELEMDKSAYPLYAALQGKIDEQDAVIAEQDELLAVLLLGESEEESE